MRALKLNFVIVMFFITHVLILRWNDHFSNFKSLQHYPIMFLFLFLILLVILLVAFRDIKLKALSLALLYLIGYTYLLKTEHFFLFGYAISDVQGRSMEPVLNSGDRLIYKIREGDAIERGDIVTTTVKKLHEEGNIGIIKAVAGVPGDNIFVCDYEVFINGDSFYNEYKPLSDCLHIEKIQLTDKSYYLLGYNKYNSHDSRYFGPVKLSQIELFLAYKVSEESAVTYF
ncbi:Signal peptidase I [Shewanella piezotolerans WP3]|uniref:Signal peptidase I n=1 Tax=Shewanella piezotolerans (strain WP3 / JCM 13877) TaxID=225849 RepID=B8CVC4_SHEPW|nr:signal peptidase I [Shewanella piezotolerans]ACJ31600.1 Signal peptidase I [Shewanella piezotolerans WP3]